MSKLSHLLDLIIMLQYKEFTTASELADILGVDKKTIYRYIDTLQMSNIPVEAKKGRYGGFYINKSFHMKYPKLEKKELEALIMASKILTKENGFFYAHEFQSAITKIKNTSLSDLKESNGLKDDISVEISKDKCLENFDDIMSKINYAMSKGRVLKIIYFSMNKNDEVERRVNPYSIFFKEGMWYLIAYCNTERDERIFEISRIEDIEITKEIFIKPKNLNLKECLDDSWKTFKGEQISIRVKFSKNIGRLVKKNEWNLNQEIKCNSSGDIVFKARINELKEIKKWILGFGSQAEILEPIELRNEIKEEMGKIVEKYSKNVQS